MSSLEDVMNLITANWPRDKGAEPMIFLVKRESDLRHLDDPSQGEALARPQLSDSAVPWLHHLDLGSDSLPHRRVQRKVRTPASPPLRRMSETASNH